MEARKPGTTDHDYMDQLQANRIVLQNQIRILQAMSEGKQIDMTSYIKTMDRSSAVRELRETNRMITQLYNSMYGENGKVRERYKDMPGNSKR
jgi:hypothetical protein